MEGGALGWYLEGRGGGRKECGGWTKMGGRSCKLWRVLDPVIPSGVLGPEAGDTVWNCFRPLVDSADRCGLAIPPMTKEALCWE